MEYNLKEKLQIPFILLINISFNYKPWIYGLKFDLKKLWWWNVKNLWYNEFFWIIFVKINLPLYKFLIPICGKTTKNLC